MNASATSLLSWNVHARFVAQHDDAGFQLRVLRDGCAVAGIRAALHRAAGQRDVATLEHRTAKKP